MDLPVRCNSSDIEISFVTLYINDRYFKRRSHLPGTIFRNMYEILLDGRTLYPHVSPKVGAIGLNNRANFSQSY
jgi:hypothetical protein